MQNDEEKFKRIQPSAPGRLLKVLKNDFKSQRFVCLGIEMYGYNSHYTKTGCVFHFDDRETCICRDQDIAIREKFFLQVLDMSHFLEWMIEVTPEGARQFNAQVKQAGIPRGKVVRVYRRGQSNRTPMCIDIEGEYLGTVEMPPVRDLLPSVKRLWKVE